MNFLTASSSALFLQRPAIKFLGLGVQLPMAFLGRHDRRIEGIRQLIIWATGGILFFVHDCTELFIL